MIKRPPSKLELRQELENATRDFLDSGEGIQHIPKGVSSRDEAQTPLKPEKWQMPKSNSDNRTYIPEVIETLEKRKQLKPIKATSSTKKPRKRLIYDDFGEPLRWVWVDE